MAPSFWVFCCRAEGRIATLDLSPLCAASRRRMEASTSSLPAAACSAASCYFSRWRRETTRRSSVRNPRTYPDIRLMAVPILVAIVAATILVSYHQPILYYLTFGAWEAASSGVPTHPSCITSPFGGGASIPALVLLDRGIIAFYRRGIIRWTHLTLLLALLL